MKYLVKMKDDSIRIVTLIDGIIGDEIDKWPDANDVRKVRVISDSDIPVSREFREAWADVSAESRVDIDMVKAKDVCLKDLRNARKIKLEDTDASYLKALSEEDTVKIDELKAEKIRLRDLPESIKNLAVSGINDEAVLAQLKILRDSV